MDIKEIINRPATAQFQDGELCLVVEHYIKRRKNVNVKINMYKIQNPMYLMLQINMLIQAFDTASRWLKENGI